MVVRRVNLELGIKRRLSYLFVALAILLIGALIYSNAQVQYGRKLEMAMSTHNVFERILSEAIKTNDVPELSRLLKRSVSRDRTFFAFEAGQDQLVLPNYGQMEEFRAVLTHTDRCLGRLTIVDFAGQRSELYCAMLNSDSPNHRFVLYQLTPAEPIAPARFIWISLIVAAIILVILWLALSKIMNDQLFSPIEQLERHIAGQLDGAEPSTESAPTAGPEEIRRLRQTFDELLGRARASFALEKKILESETKERIARQVAHDIRSPLSALNMVFARFDGGQDAAGGEGRALAKKAAQRINDIANDLLRGTQPERAPEVTDHADPVLLEWEVDGIVSEARAVFGNRPGVEITFEQRTYPRSFVAVRAAELRRALSNLIVNSVEALPEAGGHVVIAIDASSDRVTVSVADDGVGIPADRLALVGRHGYSYGKLGESGSGLGLSYAKDFADRAGGRLVITSEVGRGTRVTMTFPALATPAWYLKSLALGGVATIVVLDDDQSVHQMWRNVFAAHVGSRRELICFATGADLTAWHAARAGGDDDRTLYLIDFELAAGERSGLDLIGDLGLNRRSVLVTSRFDDAEIIARCRATGVRQIPKMAAGLIPIVERG